MEISMTGFQMVSMAISRIRRKWFSLISGWKTHSSTSASASAPASRIVEIACKEQQDFYVKHNGGYLIPTHSKIGQEMRLHFEKLLDEHGKNELVPVLSRE